MQFEYLSLSETEKAKGVVVVIDVLRAFTTSAYAFYKGAQKIIPVSSLAGAFELKARIPGSLIMGEEKGIKPKGFDFGNSPAEIAKQDLTNRTLIQRTSAGTQGLILSKRNSNLIAASFVVAKATVGYIEGLRPEIVSFIITGDSMGRDGDEDRACAEYIAGLLQHKMIDSEKFTHRILTSSVGHSFVKGEIKYLSETDIEMSSLVNMFNFAMVLQKEDDLVVMRPNCI